MLFMWIRTHVGICMYDYIYSLKIKNSFSKNLTFAMPAAAAKLLQLCLTLCDPKDYSLPGSSVYGIFQAKVLEWVAISFSRGSSRPGDWTQVSHIVGRCFTLWATREAHRSKHNKQWKPPLTPSSHDFTPFSSISPVESLVGIYPDLFHILSCTYFTYRPG